MTHLMAIRALCSLALVACISSAHAVDLTGPVQRMRVATDGTLWFSMDTAGTASYCAPGWYNMPFYVPAEAAQFPYYYALVLAAQLKGRSIYLPNITGNGSAPCDITTTGYGMALTP